MTAIGIAAAAAIGSVLAWGLTAVAIASAGGLEERVRKSSLGLGLVAIVVASPRSESRLLPGDWMELKVLGGVLGSVALGLLVQSAVGAMVPEFAGWVREEAGLWVASLITAGLTSPPRTGPGRCDGGARGRDCG